MDVSQTLEEIKNKGLRLTAARKRIIALIHRSENPISAPELLTRVDVNKTTVYRELDALFGAGIINEVDFGDGKKRYELASRDHHHHLVCVRCRSVTELDFADKLAKEERRIAAEKHVTIFRHNLEFFGLCAGCKTI